MSNINVSYQEMERQVHELRAAHGDLQMILQRVEAVMAASAQGGYRSSSQVQAAQDQHRQGARLALQGLEHMIRTLEQSADQLRQSENRLSRGF